MAKIKSLASADGWWALNLETGDASRLACWALLSDGRVIGLDRLVDADYAPETSGEDVYQWIGDHASPYELDDAIRRAVDDLRGELLGARSL